MEEFDLLLPTFQHTIDSFKIGEVVNDNNNNIADTDESRSVTNTNNNNNNNQDAIKKYSKMMKIPNFRINNYIFSQL